MIAFTLARPCSSCPFRTDLPDGPFPLRYGRAEEIAGALREEKTFTCHKTSHELGAVGVEQMCAGARAVLANEGQSVQLEWIFERLGLPVAAIPAGLPVYADFDEFIESVGGVA
jgi:Family of unknown function (DUF6283)